MRLLRQVLEVLGPAGVVGLGVLLFAGAFFFSALDPAEREVQAQALGAERLRTRTLAQPGAASDAGDDLRRFYALFPPTERLSGELERLYALARKANVELQQGEYRLEAKNPGLAAYHISLPIRGAYPQIREFVAATLAEVPIASVDALRFERKKVGETSLEAQVRLTLYFRPQDEL
jgi:hypothetical protein